METSEKISVIMQSLSETQETAENITTIDLYANDQRLAIISNPRLASGNRNSVRVRIGCSAEWDEYTKSAVFFTDRNKKMVYEILLIDGMATVPHEVLQESGVMIVGLRGVTEYSEKTSDLIRYTVIEGAPVGTGTVVDPSADVYQQILALIKAGMVKGDKGDPFTYEDFTEEQLAALKGKDGYTPIKGVDYFDGKDGKSAYELALEDGFVGTEAEFTELLMHNSIKLYGAVGDGITDDTAAFQNALENDRRVFVPGGTYKLNDTLVIKENCCLELSQDTVLQFTQTSGYAIEMRGSATLRGNHALISVPYAFAGSVIAIDTANDGEDHNSIPPYTKAGSHMSKRQRFIYDVNIIKPDDEGFCKSRDGACSGTAIYMSAEGTASIRWMWGIIMSGIRIAGGFSYGIRAANFDNPGDYEDNAWNHDMRIEAIIEACEVGVSLENCNCAYLDVTVQPSNAYDTTKYAKWGIYLNDSKNVDCSRSRVWDWSSVSLWTEGGMYQHIGLVGNCRGLILSDFIYYEDSTYDIRELIYTDTPSNLENMTILQEPITRWFKPKENEPYFFDGNGEKRLLLKEEFDQCFQTDSVPQFTNVLTTAIDTDGTIYNGTGTASGYYNSDFTTLTESGYHIHTGFIACKKGDSFITDGIGLRDDGCVRVTFFDSEFNYIFHANGSYMMSNSYQLSYAALDNGFKLTINSHDDATLNSIAYARFNFNVLDLGENPVMSVNDEIKFAQEGFLADSIKVKSKNVVGDAPSWNDLTDKPFGDMVEVFPETEFELDTSLGVFVSPRSYPDGLVAGYDYVIRYNGVDYPCTAIDAAFNGMLCVVVGNPAPLGGEDNGLPFTVANIMEGLGAFPMDGATSVTVGIKAPKKLHAQYVPTQAPYVYENTITDYSHGTNGYHGVDPELPLALLEAAYHRRPIYMMVRDKDDNGVYNDIEFFGIASVAGNYQYMALGLAYADKTSETFKIPEGTVINGTEVNTQIMLVQMGLRINTKFMYYSNAVDDFMVLFVDYTG